MAEVNRGLDILSEEQRERCIKDTIAFFSDERGEEIGVVAAGSILDFFMQNMAPDIYNRAIDDVKKMIKSQMEGMEVEFDLLKRQK